MAQGEIINEEPLALAEVKGILSKIQKRDEEFGFRTGRTFEYVSSLELQNEKKAEELKKKITELDIPRLKSSYVTKIVDIMPKTLEELKVILQGVTITNDNLKKIEGLLTNGN